MASGTFQIPEKLPWYAGPSLAKTFKSLRKYPIIPMTVLLLVLVLPAIFADFVAPYDPLAMESTKRLAGPGTPGHLLGTDAQGRDMSEREWCVPARPWC